MRHECYFCHIKTIEKLIQKFEPEPQIAEDFIFSIHELLNNNRELENTYLAKNIHQIAKKNLNNKDLYQEEKIKANALLLKSYSYWKDLVDKSENPFFTAAKLSVIGNIIDYGAHSVGDNISAQIEAYFKKDLKIDRTLELKQALNRADSVVFLGDNTGEIVFDKLFIQTINHPNLTYVVRGEPVINDATLEDAQQVGMDKLCRIIPNGSDAPSTLLEFCSDELNEIFNKADLIISKGQGNFEGLMKNKHPNLFFMLIAKCKPIAELLGVEKDDMLVIHKI